MLVGEVPNEVNSGLKYFYCCDDEKLIPLNLVIRDVKIRKTEAEKAQKRLQYRREYMKRPHVQEKIRKRLEDPEVIAKRKAYADRPEVKARKQALASRSRAIKNQLKMEKPDLYREILERIETRVDEQL